MTSKTSAAARDVHDATVLDGLGWRLSLPAFRGIRVLAALLVLCGSGAASATAFDWLARAFVVGGPVVGAVGAMAAGLYALVLHAAREALTTRRLQLMQHPFRGFFRAMDVPRYQVVMAESRGRLVRTSAAVAGICWGAAARAASAGLPWTAVVALATTPFAAAGGAFAATMIVALQACADKRPRLTAAILGGVAAGVALAWLARLCSAAFTRGAGGLEATIWPAAATVSVAASAVFLAAAVACFRALKRSPFAVGGAASEARAEIRLRRFRGASPWPRIVVSDLSPVPRAAALARLLFLVWACGAAVTGAQVLVLGPRGWAVPAVVVDRLCAVAAFAVGVALAEALSRWIGPAALSARWRAAWEAGADAAILARAPLGVALAVGTLAAFPLAVMSGALGGGALAVVAVVWSALACAWISVAVVPSEPPRPDGTAPASLSAGLLCVVASAGTVVIQLAATSAGVGWIGLLLSALLLGGAIWATRNRILSLPSRPVA